MSRVLHTIQLFLVSVTVTVCYDSYIICEVMEHYKTNQNCLKYQNSLIMNTLVLGFIIFWVTQNVHLYTIDMINLYINLHDLHLPWIM